MQVTIPPVRDTDAEDVVWGLQTAEALWKRGERADAVVWLRRAAQAAGDAADDDRALELARSAAELSEWMARDADGIFSSPSFGDRGSAAAAVAEGSHATSLPSFAVSNDDDDAPTGVSVFPEEAKTSEGEMAPAGAPEGPSRASVPPASTVHAGIYNPWDEPSTPRSVRSAGPASSPRAMAPSLSDDDGVVTSVASSARPGRNPALAQTIPQGKAASLAAEAKAALEARAEAPKPAAEAPKPAAGSPSAAAKAVPARPPPPLPPQARKAPPLPAAAQKAPPPLPSQRPTVAAEPSVAPGAEPSVAPPSQPVEASSVSDLASSSPPPPSAMASPAPEEPDATDTAAPTGAAHNTVQAPPPVLSLDDVEAFSDLPDDAREAFAAAATVDQLGEGEEVSGFALAYVLSGTFDVAATMVDAPAVRLDAGAVLRSRGSTDEGVPMRMIAVSKAATIATWTDAAVDEAFRAIPWVEEDLRALADRVQTLVGITIGPLGERIDVSIREDIVSRLTMRTLIAGDVVVEAGAPVPGLLLVGVGELELVQDGKVVGSVGSGDFLFAGEVLGAGAAPATARAGAGGALILFGDRMVAQELLVTWPPLLEVFAGM